MRRSLAIGLTLLTLFLGGVAAAPLGQGVQIAHAATSGIAKAAASPSTDTSQTPSNKSGIAKAAAAGAAARPTDSVGPGIFGPIFNFILQIFAWLLGAVGVFMAAVINHTVVEAGSFINSLGPIKTAWEVFRDLGNIFLVFGFMAIGIATILDNASYGAKKALPKLLVVALLLNFSLFAAEFVVDTGNMFATQFYTQINAGKSPTTISFSNEPISGILMDNLKLTTIYNIQDNQGVATNALADATAKNPTPAQQHWFITFLLGIILFIITTFVLGAIALMLLARFVIIVFLLIASPIGFIGLAGIPLVSDYGKKWWSALTNQTLLAPVLMLLLLVALKLIQSAHILQGAGSSFAAATTGGANGVGTVSSIASLLLGFTITAGLMIASLIIAKSLSGKAASFATRNTSRVMFGGSAFLARHTVGRGASAMQGVFGRSKFIDKHPLAGRWISSGLKRTASASFDARGIKAAKGAGIDLGRAGGRGGFTAGEEAFARRREEFAKGRGKATLEERGQLYANTEELKSLNEQLQQVPDKEKSRIKERIKMLQDENKKIKEAGANRMRAAVENLSSFRASRTARINTLENATKGAAEKEKVAKIIKALEEEAKKEAGGSGGEEKPPKES